MRIACHAQPKERDKEMLFTRTQKREIDEVETHLLGLEPQLLDGHLGLLELLLWFCAHVLK